MYKLFLSASPRNKNGRTTYDTDSTNDGDEQQQQQQHQAMVHHQDYVGHVDNEHYTENGIPFAVTVNSAFCGDDCSALDDDNGEFEMLWAQLDVQQQQPPAAPAPHAFYGAPSWTLQHHQQLLQQQLLQQHQQPLPRPFMAVVHQIRDDNEEEEEEEEEEFEGTRVRNQQYAINNSSSNGNHHHHSHHASILSELAALERTIIYHCPPEELVAGIEESRGDTRWTLQDDQAPKEGDIRESFCHEESFMTPADTADTIDFFTSPERTSTTTTTALLLHDIVPHPPSPNLTHSTTTSASASAARYYADLDTVPKELLPPLLPNRSTSPPPPPPITTTRMSLASKSNRVKSPRRSTTTTTTTPTTRPVQNSHITAKPAQQPSQPSQQQPLQRAKCITATINKPTKKTRLGFELRNTPQGAVEIMDISQDGFLFVSGVPLQVGDCITGITTTVRNASTNNNNNNNNNNNKSHYYPVGCGGGMRKQELLRLLQRTVGTMTLFAQNPTGDANRVESMTLKPHAEFGTGIFFVSGTVEAQGRLQIHRIQSRGLFASSLMSPGDYVLSINGVDCSHVDAGVAADIVKSAPRFVSIVTRTNTPPTTTMGGGGGASNDNGVDRSNQAKRDASNRAGVHSGAHARESQNRTTVPVGGDRRSSFGMFRWRSPS